MQFLFLVQTSYTITIRHLSIVSKLFHLLLLLSQDYLKQNKAYEILLAGHDVRAY